MICADKPSVKPVCGYNVCLFTNINVDEVSLEMPGYVTKIQFTNCTVKQFPSEIFRPYSFLNTADISQSRMTDIKNGDFKHASHLSFLNLAKNNISKLDSNLFAGANALRHLNLQYNNISTISDTAFKGLNNLQTLNLTDNKISAINELTFQHLTQLILLDLSYNSIAAIQSNTFSKNIWLQAIQLNFNPLYVIQDDSFLNIYQLRVLDISGNKLKHFSSKKTTVEMLVCNNCSNMTLELGEATEEIIGSFVDNVKFEFENVEAMKKIRLESSKFANLNFIKNLTNLLELDLSFSRIENYNIHAFSNLELVQTLRLGDTQLPIIDFGTFSHQRNLRILDISYNNLESIDLDTLLSNQRLYELYIDGNKLTDIGNIVEHFPTLRSIGLSDNNWNCSFLVKMISALEKAGIEIVIEDGKRVRDFTNVHGIFCINNKTDIDNLPKFSPLKHDNISHSIIERNEMKNQIEELQIQLQAIEERIDGVVDQMGLSTPTAHSGFLYTSMTILIYFVLIVIVVAVAFGIVKYSRNFYMRRQGFGSVSELHSISVRL